MRRLRSVPSGPKKGARCTRVHEPHFFSRLFFAFGCFLRVLTDPRFAASVRRLTGSTGVSGESSGEVPHEAPALPPVRPLPPPPPPAPSAPIAQLLVAPHPAPAVNPKASARVLLALLQREGRFIDFLQQPVDAFSDADVGAAARVVHAGCKKAFAGRIELEPVLREEEGSTMALSGAEEHVTCGGAGRAKAGKYTVVHRGWRITRDDLPQLTSAHDGVVVQAAEVE